jgi:hypothetical protein
MLKRPALIAILTLTTPLGGCDFAKGMLSSGAAPSASAPVASAVAPTASVAAASGEVSFDKRVPKAGTRASGTRKTSSKFTLNGKTYRETSLLESEAVVKESDEFRITKASIEVKEMYTTSQEGTGSEKRSVSPLAGSTYVVTRNEDGKLSALDSGGDKVPAATLKLIKEEFGSSFEKNQDAAFLPDRPLKLEEKLMPSSDSMLSALGIKDDGNTLIDGTEFFLKSVAGAKATFDVTMTMTQKVPGAGLRVRSKLKGKIEMRPDGAWIVGVNLKGPITILDGSGNEQGSGELSMVGTQSFE